MLYVFIQFADVITLPTLIENCYVLYKKAVKYFAQNWASMIVSDVQACMKLKFTGERENRYIGILISTVKNLRT